MLISQFYRTPGSERRAIAYVFKYSIYSVG
jgi:hypothetical protein